MLLSLELSSAIFSFQKPHGKLFFDSWTLTYACTENVDQNCIQNTLSLDKQTPTTDVQIIWFLKMFSLEDSFGHYD